MGWGYWDGGEEWSGGYWGGGVGWGFVGVRRG